MSRRTWGFITCLVSVILSASCTIESPTAIEGDDLIRLQQVDHRPQPCDAFKGDVDERCRG